MLTVSVPEPLLLVVPNVMLKVSFRFSDARLGLYTPGLRNTSAEPVSIRSARSAVAPTVKFPNQNP
jgi:hypothetical protein